MSCDNPEPEVKRRAFFGHSFKDSEEDPVEVYSTQVQVAYGDRCKIKVSFTAPLHMGPEQIYEMHLRGLRLIDPERFSDSEPLEIAEFMKNVRIYRQEHRAAVMAGDEAGVVIDLGSSAGDSGTEHET